MGIKSDKIEFRSQRTVQEIGRRLQDSLAKVKAQSIDAVESGSGALVQFDDRAEIEVVARGAELTSMWAVQVYVDDHGADRLVTLLALGDGGFTRTFNGSRHTTSLGKSIKKRDLIAQSLR